ncbi:ankyrin repeat-containing domain protein [Rhypophila decipiens]|uniref:Ankyrin repeat-containing domain protein n=1 Tax=Rhypophila decipiens TaxID=261697 RepID=A0AAN6XV56_9PEZI|nr:ankyrin repeat-containing domain protein [Rhypophila decipiens]
MATFGTTESGIQDNFFDEQTTDLPVGPRISIHSRTASEVSSSATLTSPACSDLDRLIPPTKAKAVAGNSSGNPPGRKRVKALLEKGAYVNGYSTRHPNGRKTPLILALERDALDIAEILLRNGADVSRKGSDKKTPLALEMERTLASKDKSLLYLDLLLRHGANANDGLDNTTLLKHSIFNLRVDLVEILSRGGADVTSSLLKRAMVLEDENIGLEIAATLIRYGARVFPDASQDCYPLAEAILFARKCLPWVKLLVSQGADPMIVYKGTLTFASGKQLDKPSLIHLCLLINERDDVLEYLLSLKVSPNTICSYSPGHRKWTYSRMTRLHLATSARQVHTLVRYGANILSKDSLGRIPLHWAAVRGETDIILAYLEHGSYSNARTNLGSTPLHTLVTRFLCIESSDIRKRCRVGYVDSVKALLIVGARVDLEGWNGLTVDETMEGWSENYQKLSEADRCYFKEQGWCPHRIWRKMRVVIWTFSGRIIRLNIHLPFPRAWEPTAVSDKAAASTVENRQRA